MRFAIQLVGLLIGLPLHLLIIAAMLRGGYKRFPLVFVYTIVDFLTTVMESMPAINYFRGVPESGMAELYWRIEVVMQVLVYAVVLSLIYEATARLASRRAVRTLVVVGALLVAIISLAVHYSPSLTRGEWMTPWTRDLNFSSVILDLGLWMMLIGQRKKDQRLLMLSGALGIEFTGDAIGASLRQLAQRNHSRSISFTGGTLGMLADLTFLFIWWQTFRTDKAAVPAADRVGREGELRSPESRARS